MSIQCEFAGCENDATTGGIVVVQPNGLSSRHAAYYACDDHPRILAEAVETWPVRTEAGR